MTVVELAKTKIWQRARAADRARAGASTRSYYLVMIVTGILLGFGLVMILSASSISSYTRFGSSFLYFKRQLVWAAIGVGSMLVVSRIDYRRWRPLGWGLLIASLGGLVLVLHPALGTRVGGSSRWLGFGNLRVQPSELAKLALLLVTADVAVRKQGKLRTLRDVMLPIGVIAAFAAGLVLMQPDLGTTVIFSMIVFVVIFVGGTPIPLLATMGLLAGVGAFGLALTKGYMRARIFSFLNPFKDPLNAGWQSVQGLIALGSGGFFGVGLGASRQKWSYVPNAHTDFIFAILGEELGLIGTFMVIGLFAAFAYAGVRIARRAPDPFGRLIAIGVTVWIVGQGIINMGAVTGLLPITGVPLPLVSFGGSALVFSLTAIGILLNVARQERWPPEPASALARERGMTGRGAIVRGGGVTRRATTSRALQAGSRRTRTR